MLCREGTKASEDAEIIKNLQETGAILIGVTNVPELNLWIETRNYVFGQTNNPYNTNRIAGGSSGGEVITLVPESRIRLVGLSLIHI